MIVIPGSDNTDLIVRKDDAYGNLSTPPRDGKLKTEMRTNKAVTMEPFIGASLYRIVTANLSLWRGLMMLSESQKPRPLLPANSVI